MPFDILADDSKRIAQCFNDNYQALCYYASSLLHDDGASEDVVQDVFCKVIGSGRTFDNGDHLRSYLYIAVRNSCINLLRRGPKASVDIGNEAATALRQIEDEADYEMVRAEIIRKISAAIDTLPPRYREVFELAYVQDVKTEEIARQMAISPNTVKVMKLRAKKHLRELLKDLYPLLFLLLEEGI